MRCPSWPYAEPLMVLFSAKEKKQTNKLWNQYTLLTLFAAKENSQGFIY